MSRKVTRVLLRYPMDRNTRPSIILTQIASPPIIYSDGAHQLRIYEAELSEQAQNSLDFLQGMAKKAAHTTTPRRKASLSRERDK